MIQIIHRGDFSKVIAWLEKSKKGDTRKVLEKYGKIGVEALRNATPVDTGLTASSWRYEIAKDDTDTRWVIEFHNDNVNKHVNIALILQYGHGTGTGGWVEGRDYINPALQPIFDQMAEEAWEEVSR